MSLSRALEMHDEDDVNATKTSVVAPSRWTDYLMIAKPRLSLLVLMTTAVGYYFGSLGHWNWQGMLEVVFGTALVALGSGALNQCIEWKTDKLMRRTENRPVPAERLSYSEVLNVGVILSIAGLTFLEWKGYEVAAIIAALTLVLYVFVYTPLKRYSTLNTLVGALPGALPPLIGYSAARGVLDWPAYTLFAILFVWQLPHFLAIAWLYRAEYAKAGLRMLPNEDPDGIATGVQIFIHTFTLLPLSLLPCLSFIQMAHTTYKIGALILGVLFLSTGVLFLIKRNDAAARKVFLASVIYFPLLFSLMMYDSKS